MAHDESSQSENGSAARSLLERLSHALLGEPANRAELIEILRDAAGRDLIDREALDMIEGVLQVSDMQVREIMVPRGQMDVVDFSRPPDEFLPVIIESGHSRFPVIDADKDKVVGILLAKELLRYLQLDKRRRAKFNLRDILRPAVFVPEAKRLNVLLREFKASRNHMAIVVDEYGGVACLVTIEDEALTTLEDFNSRFGTDFHQGEIDTVGGLVMARLGRVPRRGERLELAPWIFEVLRADSRRIHLLKLTRDSESG